MRTDDASAPAKTEPNCGKCGGTTKLVSFIPRFGDRPAYRIFECIDCDALTWETQPTRDSEHSQSGNFRQTP